jgi:hypothetical protein
MITLQFFRWFVCDTWSLSLLSEKHTLTVLENECKVGLNGPEKQKEHEDKQYYTAPPRRNSPQWARAFSLSRLRDHTQTHHTL